MAINKAKQAATTVKKMIDRERELSQLVRSLKEELDGIKGQMLDAMVYGDIDRVETEEFQVTRVQGTHTRLDKVRLVEEGVSPDIIEAATKRTPYSYIKISERKEVKIA